MSSEMRNIYIPKHELSKLYKLKNLTRYNPRTKITNESVAEHSFYVALFSLMISTELNMTAEQKLNCITKALLHDLPEIDLSDIPHNVKQKFPELRKALEKAEGEWFCRFMPQFKDLFTSAEEDDIVEISDVYSVIQYCEYEKELGNTSFDDICENAENRINRILNKYI